jgi:hypothetical protein
MTPNDPHYQTEYNLTSEKYKPLIEALDLLYIKGNMGGRIQFMKEWPEVAYYIFGPEMIQMDTEGTTARDKREALEAQAEQNRVDFLEIMQTLEAKSADKGVLQTEYVTNLVRSLGRDLALLMYAPRIVDRIIPPSASEAVPTADKNEKKAAPTLASPRPVPVEEAPIEMPEDPLDKIKPIST